MKKLIAVAGVSLFSAFLFCNPLFAQPTPPGGGGNTNGSYDFTNYVSMPYVPGVKLTINAASQTNLSFGFLEADPAAKYDIYYETDLLAGAWSDILQGTNGQSNFSLTLPQSANGFFRTARTDTPVTDAASMTVSFPNNLVSTNFITANVSGGPAAAMAYLVNDTNFADAQWFPFSAVPDVLLGTTDGTYQVWMGLTGSNGIAYWSEQTIVLDRTPMQLAITNLMADSGSRPFIDPAGYTTKALKSLTFEVVHADGTTNSGGGIVVEQTLNPANPLYVTNWFACLDLPLAIGTNQIAITGTDLAGNVASTNFDFLLETNDDTTPPAISLIWPQNGAQIIGTNFTVQGTLDDDTATVMGQFVDTNGVTNAITGEVERGGTFWLDNMPLNPGTNFVTVIATDFAGNVSTTNLTVIQGSLSLTITPLSDSDLLNAYATVRGTVSDAGASISVNGIQGTNNGDGTWEVDNVPLPSGGTVPLVVTAQSSTTNQAQSVDFRQPVVFTQKYTYNLDDNYASTLNGVTNYFYSSHIDFHWTRGVGGERLVTSFSTNVNTGVVTESLTDDTWPADNSYTPTLTGTDIIQHYRNGVLTSGFTNYYGPEAPPPVEWMEQSITNGTNPMYVAATYSESSSREIRLFTGGRATRQKQSLFCLSASLNQEQYLDQSGMPDWTALYWSGHFLGDGQGVPTNQISLGNLGTLGNDGKLWTVLPDNREIIITPGAPVPSFDGNLPGQQKYNLAISFNGTDVTDSNTTVIVGQQIALTCALKDDSGDDLTSSLSNFQWTIPGFAISNYVPTLASGIVYTSFPTNNANVVFYWADAAAGRTVECSATFNGINIIAQTTFDVLKPSLILEPIVEGGIYVDDNYYQYPGGSWLHFGGYTNNYGEFIPGISFQVGANSTNALGQNFDVELVQVGSIHRQGTFTSGTNWFKDYSGLDNEASDWIYPKWEGTNAPMDSPAEPAGYGDPTRIYTAANDNFVMYLMFKYDPNSIYVPMQSVNWSWSGSATNSAGVWQIISQQPPSNLSVNPDPGFPQWTNHIQPATQWTSHIP